MTLLQLHYLVAVAEKKSINKASKHLFVSQSCISAALRDLEEEIGIAIFVRNNQGVSFTKNGLDFYNHIRPILEQEKKVTDLYSRKGGLVTRKLRVSSQHYPFVTHAFVAFLQSLDDKRYDLSLIETDTNSIITDVASGKSNLGIIYLSDSNEGFIEKILHNQDISFHMLKKIRPHVFVRKGHPLTLQKHVDTGDLSGYPYAMFNIDDDRSAAMNFAEEILPAGFEPSPCIIQINDRYTMYSVLSNSDAFSIGSGLLTPGFSDPGITSVPFGDPACDIRLGYIKQKVIQFGKIEASFVAFLEECLQQTSQGLEE